MSLCKLIQRVLFSLPLKVRSIKQTYLHMAMGYRWGDQSKIIFGGTLGKQPVTPVGMGWDEFGPSFHGFLWTLDPEWINSPLRIHLVLLTNGAGTRSWHSSSQHRCQRGSWQEGFHSGLGGCATVAPWNFHWGTYGINTNITNYMTCKLKNIKDYRGVGWWRGFGVWRAWGDALSKTREQLAFCDQRARLKIRHKKIPRGCSVPMLKPLAQPCLDGS